MKQNGFFLMRGLLAVLSSLFFAIIIGGCFYIYLASQVPSVNSLKTVQLQVPLRIYTQDGLLIQEYGEKRRIPVTYEQIPPTLIHAVIATEDQRFFDHSGVDIFGLGRAAVRMLQTGTKSQGGSTITMQVARNFFLDRKKTFLRKFHEIMLAIKIDRELSKEKILELYLNKIYLGNRAYGVGAAAQIYYDKPLNELNLAQLAMLAGLPQAPSTQNPIANPAAAKKRRDHVLERLLEEKYISQNQYNEAIQEPISTKNYGGHIEVNAPYVAEMIRQSLFEHFGADTYTKGYKVYTTINANLQTTANHVVETHLLAYDHRHGYRKVQTNIGSKAASSAERQRVLKNYPNINDLQAAVVTAVGHQTVIAVMRNEQKVEIPWQGLSWARPALRNGWVGKAPTKASDILKIGDVIYLRQTQKYPELTQIPEVESALVALNPQNGAINALVGGFNFQKSKFNRATQSSRQPGSSFKPFIYAAALNKGYSLATLINDAPIVVDDPSQANLWRPHNDKLKFNGPTRLKEALAHSLNLVSIRILDDIGIDYAVDFVQQFGFQKNNLPRALSLALGSLSVSPLDLTAAYAVFANGGYKIEPYLIDRITDGDDKILVQAKPLEVCTDCSQHQRNAPRVIPSDVDFLMHSAMQETIQHGTAQSAMSLRRNDLAGKTGTTNDKVDAWFAGYNQDLVAVTWVGFDTPSPLHEYANQLALPMWIDFMRIALKGIPERAMAVPSNIITVPINPSTGLQVPQNEANALLEYFRKNEVPALENNGTFTAASPSVETNMEEHLF